MLLSLHRSWLIFAAMWIPLLGATPGTAQDANLGRPADTSSPRATLKSLIDGCNEVHRLTKEHRYVDRKFPEHRAVARRVVDCIDDSELPEYARLEASAEAAIIIKEILDRVELPPYEEIPDDEAIEAMPDGLDRWQIPGTRLAIVRITEGPRKHDYLFSSGTVSRCREYYEDLQYVPYRTTGPDISPDLYKWYFTAPSGPMIGAVVDWLPKWMNNRVLGLAGWQWIALVLLTALGIAALFVLYRIQQNLSLRLKNRPVLFCLTIVFPLLALAVPRLLRYWADDVLGLRGDWLYGYAFAVNIVLLITVVLLVFGIINRVAALIISSPKINPKGLDAQVIRILSKIGAMAISVFVFLEGGQYLGIPITTLLASAGVGGLAVALAAQDTLKNLFGTIMLMADKPFRVGERVIVASYDGEVEDIGLRSTRLRLLNGHQVTVPNDELARADIENVGRRPFIRRVSNFQVPLDTPREKVQKAVELIRDAVANHEGMAEDRPPRVFFDEINDDAFNIKMFIWYHPAQYWDYMAFCERLNLEILNAFEQQQIRFQLPTRVAQASFESQPAPLEVKMIDPQ